MKASDEARMWELWRDETYRRGGGLTDKQQREYNRLKKKYEAEKKGERDDKEKIRV